VNFEVSLTVFIPNTPRNRAISYTNITDICFIVESIFLNNNCYFRIIKSFFVTKGSQFSTTPAKLEADLTADMLARFVVNLLQM